MSRAVVIGAGISGLLAGAAAARHVDSVVIVERDELSSVPGPRTGVPQASHVHALLAAGQRDIEYLVPGFMATVLDHGGSVYDFANDVVMRNPFGWGVRFSSGIPALGASRSLVEWAIRNLVLARPNVILLQRHRCVGMVPGATAVAAVRVNDGRERNSTALEADLIIDATGRGSHTDRWLADIGYSQPTVDVVDSGVCYASRVYRRPAHHRPDWQACYIQLGLEDGARGATVMPLEDDRWLITLLSLRSDPPARNEHDFLDFARTLSTPLVADTILASDPLTPVTTSRSTSSRRARPGRGGPRNFIRLGDAACSFNPLYAQGMSTAARSAKTLENILHHRDPTRVARVFQRRLAAATSWPWLVATSADARRPGTTSTTSLSMQQALGRHLDRVQLAGTVDSQVQHRFLEVFNMLRPPPALLAPAMLARTARRRVAVKPIPAEPPDPVAPDWMAQRYDSAPRASLPHFHPGRTS